MLYMLRKTMRAEEITNRDLANALGVSEKTVSQKINGKSDFSWRQIRVIKELFPDMSYELLFADDDDIPAT